MPLSTDPDDAPAVTLVGETRPHPLQPECAARPRSSRYQSLDMWRGAACLMLVMYHATFYASHSWRSSDPNTWTLGGLAIFLVGRMWIGVPIFFVVSGYCIAASSDASRHRGGHRLRTYFFRRFRRIYPPLWAASALCVVFVLLATTWASVRIGCHELPALGEFTAGNWLGNFFALESWRTNLSGGQRAYLMLNTWTLCYEEQFYFVVGLLLLVSAHRFFPAAAAVTAVTIVARHLSRVAGSSLEGFFCDGHWVLFAVGILVYYRLQHARPSQHRLVIATLVTGAVYASVDRRLSGSGFEKHLDAYLLASTLFGLLLIGLYRKDKQLAANRWLQPLAWYGQMSFSVYLTHFPVVVAASAVLSRVGTTADWFVAVVTVPLSVVLSIALGRAFHLAVERQFMNAPLDVKPAMTIASLKYQPVGLTYRALQEA